MNIDVKKQMKHSQTDLIPHLEIHHDQLQFMSGMQEWFDISKFIKIIHHINIRTVI